MNIGLIGCYHEQEPAFNLHCVLRPTPLSTHQAHSQRNTTAANTERTVQWHSDGHWPSKYWVQLFRDVFVPVFDFSFAKLDHNVGIRFAIWISWTKIKCLEKRKKKILQSSGSQHCAQGLSGNFKKYWCLNSILKNWCFWTVVLEKTLESPLDCKEIQPVHPKGNQSWIFTGRTDAEAETSILWPIDVKNWLIWKDPDAGKDWGWEEKGTTEDEMVG